MMGNYRKEAKTAKTIQVTAAAAHCAPFTRYDSVLWELLWLFVCLFCGCFFFNVKRQNRKNTMQKPKQIHIGRRSRSGMSAHPHTVSFSSSSFSSSKNRMALTLWTERSFQASSETSVTRLSKAPQRGRLSAVTKTTSAGNAGPGKGYTVI